MAYVSGNRTLNTTFGTRMTDIGAAAIEGYKNWRTYQRTLNELRSLSMREMNDLGINPSMLRRIALEAAYGKNA